MPDYSKTLIYKIEHVDGGHTYVGHTTNLAARRAEHKSTCLNPNSKDHKGRLYRTIRENGGWDAFTMVPVKLFPCKSKIEAMIEEERVRVELKATMNSHRAHTPPEVAAERRAALQTDRIAKYRADNADAISAYRFLTVKTKKYTEADLE